MTNLEKLVTDAGRAGYEVTRGPEAVTIRKRVPVNQSASRSVGLVVYADGTAYRIEVDLSVAAGIRSFKAMRQILGV